MTKDLVLNDVRMRSFVDFQISIYSIHGRLPEIGLRVFIYCLQKLQIFLLFITLFSHYPILVSGLLLHFQPAVIASDDQPVAAFLNNLDGAAFFDVHVSHSFKDFRNTEHPFYGAGIACVCL